MLRAPGILKVEKKARGTSKHAVAQLPVMILNPCPTALLSALTEQIKLLFHRLARELTRSDTQAGKNSTVFLTFNFLLPWITMYFKSRAAQLKYKEITKQTQLRAEGNQ